MTSVSSSALRDVMAKFATGVTVLTTPRPDLHGMTANAFTSVSLDPPLVLGCIANTAHMHEAICRAQRFAVTILSADQCPVALHFASRHRGIGAEQFRPWDWFPGPGTGAPVIADGAGWLECEVVNMVAAGDHTIVIGLVVDCGRGDADGLAFYCGELSPLREIETTLAPREVA